MEPIMLDSTKTLSMDASLIRYTSPRCVFDDDVLLPMKPGDFVSDPEVCWKTVSEQAGSHRQDDSVLQVNHRRGPVSPLAFKAGVPPRKAARTKTLFLIIVDQLPEWLDVLSHMFFHLEHLYLTPHQLHDSDQAARMRRLYVLYRLPDLITIDGKPVTPLERELARPNHPNGRRVSRSEWLCQNALMDEQDSDSSDEEDHDETHDDIVEVTLDGVLKHVRADPLKESWDEPAWEIPYQPPPKPALPPLLMSEVSEDESTNGSCLEFKCPKELPCPRDEPLEGTKEQQQSSPQEQSPKEQPRRRSLSIRSLNACARSERYYAAQESEITFVIENPHRLVDQEEKEAVEPDPETPLPKAPNDPASNSPSPEQPEKGILAPFQQGTPPYALTIAPDAERIDPLPRQARSRLSPSRSLTSPFPMQFRSRKSPPNIVKSASSPQVITESMRLAIAEATVMETIDIPISTSLSPVHLLPRKKLARDDRPPPCPGARRPVPEMRGKRRKRFLRGRRTPQAMTSAMRNTSMLDSTDEESSDDEGQGV